MTIFEKIIRREIPAEIVFEDEEVLAFRDVNPQAPVHVLIVPKRLIARLADANVGDGAMLGKAFEAEPVKGNVEEEERADEKLQALECEVQPEWGQEL